MKLEFLKPILKLAQEKMWPWILNTIWPIIKDNFIEISKFVIERLVATFKTWLDRKAQDKSNEFEQRAKDSQQKAESASSETERAVNEAEAKIWRQVAEEFRKENEELKSKLDQLEKEAQSDFVTKTEHARPDLTFSGSTPTLKISGKTTTLPSLK